MDNPKLVTARYSGIVFDEGLYPRVAGHDPVTVQSYAEDMEEIEAAGKYMSINADNKLIDGRHRMLAYKKRAGDEDPEITVYQYDVSSPLESFRIACSLQDRGKSLSDDDRVAAAKKLYALGDQSQQEIAKALGVTPGRVSQWLSRTIKEEKERKYEKALALWHACYTQAEIAEAVGVEQSTVQRWRDDFMQTLGSKDFIKSGDFTPPIYNVWKQQDKSNGVSHYGNSEPRWLENLLYLYTNPADVVVDPFAGSGSTIDVCKKRGRRYFVSDHKPIVEREHEIREHDITTGLPRVPRWKDVQLVYLDPPYWKQAEGKYSGDPNDLANMSLGDFTRGLYDIIKDFAQRLNDAYIALIIQPTQWSAPDHQYTDHITDILRMVSLPIDMRYSAPYESQQCTAQMVNWAKENRRCLVLTREIIVWRVK
uniref:ParB domain-containing protein nuclease n=1 Tax=bacterium enrichment culture clone fosmid MGS-K1 TaxID=1549356 RepID=A0A0B5KQS7_9BACT|nr:ParB domain-containing protein nuclease [bacterium enrichment culture clone fosmid MGS-K1]